MPQAGERSASEILGRLKSLRLVLCRMQLELHLTKGAPRDRLRVASDQLNVDARAAAVPTPREQSLLDRPFGEWTLDEIAQLAWRNEAAVALLWALGLLAEMPPYTAPVPAKTVMDHLDRLKRTDGAPQLRERTLREDALELATFWNWRARTEQFRRSGMPAPPGDTYDATIQRAIRSIVDAGLIRQENVGEGDVMIVDVRYANVDGGTFLQLACIAFERQLALEWVNDATKDWDTLVPST
jgi:hypothetical protein